MSYTNQVHLLQFEPEPKGFCGPHPLPRGGGGVGLGVERKLLYFLNYPELSAGEIKNDF